MEAYPIILFDGVCNLCNGAVQFIIERDSKAKLKFAALQSDIGVNLVKKHQLSEQFLDTIVLIENGNAYVRSEAVLRLSRHLDGYWSWLYGLLIVPKFVRDSLYNFIGKNRYQWFGKEESCMMPTPDLQLRFLSMSQ